jgi:hypothetical protein
MENRISEKMDGLTECRRVEDAKSIGEILEELLARYEAKFPNLHVAFVETPANAL